MKTQHWALLAAAAFLYYMTTQRTNIAIAQPGNKPNTGMGPFDPGSGPLTGQGVWDDTGFIAPRFPHTPTPGYAYNTMSGYEGGMNWPARDNIFG